MTEFLRRTSAGTSLSRQSFVRGTRVVFVTYFAALMVSAVASGERHASEPEPRIVSPGRIAAVTPVAPPSDAVVLFDGTSLDSWRGESDEPAVWHVDGQPGAAMTIKPGGGGIFSKMTYADAQIHVEFATPSEPKGEGQERGNSGVYIQGRYEVQVLDSFKNSTYPNGQCGAIYAQHAPLVNASRGPGEWQTYDIIFRAAKFDDAGKRIAPARLTVIHNGVLIQDHAEASGETTAAPMKEGSGDGPLFLQDHGNAVRYRNIWIRRL